MQSLTIKNTILGQGQPKIIIPLTGKEDAEILAEAKAVGQLPSCDMVEWRLDLYDRLNEPQAVCRLANQLAADTGQPLIITLRTAAEGGAADLSAQAYFDIYKYLIENADFDLLDIQLQTPAAIRAALVALAHAKGIKVIMSYHDFTKTPAIKEMARHLQAMAANQADVAKIAVMPHDHQDVLDLLSVTAEMSKQLAIPVITMAMGDLGKITRVSGEIFGSAATFGIAQTPSAPGQLPVTALKQILDMVSALIV